MDAVEDEFQERRGADVKVKEGCISDASFEVVVGSERAGKFFYQFGRVGFESEAGNRDRKVYTLFTIVDARERGVEGKMERIGENHCDGYLERVEREVDRIRCLDCRKVGGGHAGRYGAQKEGERQEDSVCIRVIPDKTRSGRSHVCVRPRLA